MQLTVARLALAENCVWWTGAHVNPAPEAPLANTLQTGAFREVLERHYLRRPVEWPEIAWANKLPPPSVDRVRAWYNAWCASPLATEVWRPVFRFAYRPSTDTAREVTTPLSEVVPQTDEIMGTVDLHRLDGDRVTMVDVRTGVATPGEIVQLRVLAVALARIHQVSRVDAILARVSESGVTRIMQELDTEELEPVVEHLRTVTARSATLPIPGWYCRGLQCPAFVVCPRP